MTWVRRIALLAIALPTVGIEAQALPHGTGRPWLEFDLGVAREQQNCTACARSGAIGGAFFSLGAGVSVARSLGIGLLVRAFGEGNFQGDYQESRYLILIGQYAPPILGRDLALHVGAGEGWHFGSTAPGRFEQAVITENRGNGTALSAGFSLRVPSGSTAALAIAGDVTHTVTGRTATLNGGVTPYRPTLVDIGIGFSLAGKPRK